MSGASTAPDAPTPLKLRKGQRLVYKELQGRKWRAAIAMSVARNGDAVKLLWTDGRTVSDHDASVALVRSPTAAEEADLEAHWELLLDESTDDATTTVEHEPLHVLLRRRNHKANKVGPRHVRLMTWNVKHFGATAARLRVRDRNERARLLQQREAHDDERMRNIVEVVFQSRCALVVMQEIAREADTAALCALLDERVGRQGQRCWHATEVVGEHAMLYDRNTLAAALGCSEPDGLSIECGLYDRGTTLSDAYRQATDWDAVAPRFDFALGGASDARLPAFFFARDASHPSGRSVAICSVHLAYGRAGKSDTRERQLAQLASLMPGGDYEPSRCLYALLGDFNSNASVAERGHDFASSAVGDAAMACANSHASGHVLALAAGKKTSVGGERYDEMIVHGAALGRRHAHVFPPRERLVPHMQAALPVEEQQSGASISTAFFNIFSDHLPVYCDLEFVSAGTVASSTDADGEVADGGEVAACCEEASLDGGERAATKIACPPALSQTDITCKRCSVGKGCRWRGKPGHLPSGLPPNGDNEEVEL